jgi:hypothetical protein
VFRDCDIRRRGEAILLGIALDNAALDFETTEQQLRDCLLFLNQFHEGLSDLVIGKFGEFQVRVNAHSEDTYSIFVDGPAFDPPRDLSAAIWLSKRDLRFCLTKALSGA